MLLSGILYIYSLLTLTVGSEGNNLLVHASVRNWHAGQGNVNSFMSVNVGNQRPISSVGIGIEY
jgi:hypothetical protein